METHFYIFGISDHTIKAICWTLFHSLWIGLIAAALAGAIIATTKKSSSRLRFQLLCGILILFIILTGYTFIKQLDIAYSEQTAVASAYEAGSIGFVQVQPAETTTGISNYIRFANALNAASRWIVAAWMLCFIFKSIQLSRELLYIRQVRRKGVTEIEGEWKQLIADCSRQLGIRRIVRVFESKIVNVPVTIGHLKPVILLPVGMILQLPAAQVESILYHELAHILRRDYLINILISIAESVYFFNPAIWWLCALIREERETCCDDIVLANIPQKRNYLEALMAFQRYENPAGKYAMGLSMRPSQLMNRLRRMVNQENQRLNSVEKIVILSGLLLFSIFVFVPKANSEVRNGVAYLKRKIQAIVTDHKEKESLAENASIPLVKPAHHKPPTITKSTGTMAPKDTTITITSILFKHTNADTSNMEMQVADDHGNHYQLKVVADKLVALNINNSQIADDDLHRYDGLFRNIQRAYAAIRQEKQAKNTAFQRSGVDSVAQKKAIKRRRSSGVAVAAAPELKKAKRHHAPEVHDTTTIGARTVALKKKRKPLDISNDQQRVRGVLSALVNENVVPDESKVDWFGLTENELIVNGRKQPEALHQKLKTQYGIKPQSGLYFGPVKITGPGIYLDKKDL